MFRKIRLYFQTTDTILCHQIAIAMTGGRKENATADNYNIVYDTSRNIVIVQKCPVEYITVMAAL